MLAFTCDIVSAKHFNIVQIISNFECVHVVIAVYLNLKKSRIQSGRLQSCG